MSDITNCSSVLDEVFAERKRQEELKAVGKFLWSCADNGFLRDGDLVSVTDAEKMCVLSEEVGEAARELTDSIIAVSKGMPNVSEQHLRKLRVELIQVAAVAVAWVESLNKRGLKP